MKRIDLFYCSKPLQYLNAQNVPFKDNSNKKVLLLVRNFYHADEFLANIRKFDNHWDDIVSFKNTIGAYFYILTHNIINLHINYDNGTMIGIFYHIKNLNVYLLEEGAATYLDYYFKKSKIRRYIDNLLGVSSYLGHSNYLRGAYVYYPELYNRRKNVPYDILPFNCSFHEAIRNAYDTFLKISSIEDLSFLEIKESKILVYVTDWTINKMIIKKIESESNKYDFVYIKPHPHISAEDLGFSSDVRVIRTNLMIEFMFFKWIDNNNKITVYHEGTSAIFYYNNYVESIDMSPNKDSEYNRLISGR